MFLRKFWPIRWPIFSASMSQSPMCSVASARASEGSFCDALMAWISAAITASEAAIRLRVSNNLTSVLCSMVELLSSWLVVSIRFGSFLPDVVAATAGRLPKFHSNHEGSSATLLCCVARGV